MQPYLKDNAFVQMLLLDRVQPRRRRAPLPLHRRAAPRASSAWCPILRPYEAIGSTDDIFFETTKHCYDTTNSHINRVALDSGWEAKLAEVLDGMPEVVAFVKNQGLNFKIPYTYEGRAGHYVPDYLIRLRDDAGTGPDDLLTLVLEVTGERKKEKQAKVATATDLWVPAVNNWGGLGRWAFLEVTDPWDAENLIREFLGRSTPDSPATGPSSVGPSDWIASGSCRGIAWSGAADADTAWRRLRPIAHSPQAAPRPRDRSGVSIEFRRSSRRQLTSRC